MAAGEIDRTRRPSLGPTTNCRPSCAVNSLLASGLVLMQTVYTSSSRGVAPSGYQSACTRRLSS